MEAIVLWSMIRTGDWNVFKSAVSHQTIIGASSPDWGFPHSSWIHTS